eukprot:2492087-Pleurochrysis_carterae.AAC.1
MHAPRRAAARVWGSRCVRSTLPIAYAGRPHNGFCRLGPAEMEAVEVRVDHASPSRDERSRRGRRLWPRSPAPRASGFRCARRRGRNLEQSRVRCPVREGRRRGRYDRSFPATPAHSRSSWVEAELWECGGVGGSLSRWLSGLWSSGVSPPERTQNAVPVAVRSRVAGLLRGPKRDPMWASRSLSLTPWADVERLACPAACVVGESFLVQSRCQCCPPQCRQGRHCKDQASPSAGRSLRASGCLSSGHLVQHAWLCSAPSSSKASISL